MLQKIIDRISSLRLALCLLLVMAVAPAVEGRSFALDSIAEWGKFPRFCVGVYRWGDKFFNTYDSAYVVGTGTKFNVKVTADSWLDFYRFVIPGESGSSFDDRYVDLVSRPSTSIGVHLTYLAVSVGYDINLTSLFRGIKEARQRYQFGFNCALFGFEAYREINSTGTKLTRLGNSRHLNIPYNGMQSDSWGIDVYYFLNNKRYSQSAAFSFSKIQKKSQGSFYGGLSVFAQNYDFDFSGLPPYLLSKLPEEWENNHFISKTQNYGFKLGYAYNWVFRENWLLGVSVSPTIGVKHGYTNSDTSKTGLSLYNRAQMSVVWNKDRWFAGVIGNANTAIVRDRQTTFLGSELSVTAAVGYRFNLW